MSWHEEALAPGCLEVLSEMEDTHFIADFYLAGGTALAFQLGHRISVDLDFFSDKNHLHERERASIRKELARKTQVKTLDEKDETLHVQLGQVHASFFYFDPPLLEKPKYWHKVQIASLLDIGCMKISAIIGRGSRKDFIDLYVITKDYIPLSSLLEKAQKKFRHSADFAAQAIRALVYFKDAEQEDPPRPLQPILWTAVKTHFEKEVRKLSREFL